MSHAVRTYLLAELRLITYLPDGLDAHPCAICRVYRITWRLELAEGAVLLSGCRSCLPRVRAALKALERLFQGDRPDRALEAGREHV